MRRLFYIFALFVCFVSAQSQHTSGPTLPVILKHADVLEGRGDSLAPISRELIGHVRLEQGNVKVKCDKASQFFADNHYEFIGNVVINQDSLTIYSSKIIYYASQFSAHTVGKAKLTDRGTTLTADSAVYSTFTHIAYFYGSALLENDSVRIASDKASYNKDNSNSVAIGRVKMRNKKNITEAFADTVLHFKNTSFSILNSDAYCLKLDTSKDSTPESIKYDTTILKADHIESVSEPIGQRQYIGTGNVKVQKKNFYSESNRGEIKEGENEIILTESPFAIFDSTQIYADTLKTIRITPEYSSIYAISNAMACYRDDSIHSGRINQISGTIITMYVKKDTILNLTSIKDARSLYFKNDENQPDGVVKIPLCDTIVVMFSQGKAESIEWQGGARGDYVPEKLINANIKELYLPKMRWMEQKPQKLELPLKYIE